MTDNDRLNGDSELIVALASGRDVRSAAAQAGVSESTAYRRLREPGFRRRVSAARGEYLYRALGLLSQAAVAAVATLAGLLKCDSPSTRLGAARAILELGVKMRESVDLEERLAAMEHEISTGGSE